MVFIFALTSMLVKTWKFIPCKISRYTVIWMAQKQLPVCYSTVIMQYVSLILNSGRLRWKPQAMHITFWWCMSTGMYSVLLPTHFEYTPPSLVLEHFWDYLGKSIASLFNQYVYDRMTSLHLQFMYKTTVSPFSYLTKGRWLQATDMLLCLASWMAPAQL